MTKVYCDQNLCYWNSYGGCQRDKLNLVEGKCVEKSIDGVVQLSFPYMRLVGCALVLVAGINIWQYAMANEYDSKGVHKPLMKRLFGVEAALTFVSGVYLILVR